MQTTKLDIQIIKDKIFSPVDLSTLANFIFIEDSDEHNAISQITLSGKYNRVYYVASFFTLLDSHRVLIDNDMLLIALFEQLAVVDLKQDKLARVITFDNCYGILNICKLKLGYFIHGEGINYFLAKNFDIQWKVSCADLFVNMNVENIFEAYEDYVTVFDWFGDKHYYNETGEYKCEKYPQYNHYNKN